MRWAQWTGPGLVTAAAAWAAPRPVPEAEPRLWLNHLLPLPHEIAIPASVTLRPADVRVVLQAGAGPAQKQIESELLASARRAQP